VSKERLQKVLSQAGFGSRRAMEEWIEQGLVRVNDVVAKLGDSAGPEDKIFVNDKSIRNPLYKQDKIRILLYHKPIGEICSRADPDHPQTVFENIPPIKNGRWVMVGRLDINTSGLLIFTNSGELANQLMHPKFGLEREYAVRVHGDVTDKIVKNLREGVELEDGKAQFKRIEFRGGEGTNSWYHVVLTEGKNREVRRLWESQHIEVSRLIRVRYGQFELPRSLSRGQFLELSDLEVNQAVALYFPERAIIPAAEVAPAKSTVRGRGKNTVNPTKGRGRQIRRPN
jgi:23S rRNA pseudouridine2605 synthase